MADKMRFIGSVDVRRVKHPVSGFLWDAFSLERIDGGDLTIRATALKHDSPEAAVDALFWNVA